MCFNKLKEVVKEFLFPSNITCYICDKDLTRNDNTHICKECKKALPFIKNPCNKCGKNIDENDSCYSCSHYAYSFDRALAVLEFDGLAKDVIYKFKKSSHRYLAEFMGYFMANTFKKSKLKVDAVMCVPMMVQKKRYRGFNQSEDLLCSFNKHFNFENLSECIVQRVASIEQKNLTAKDRFEAVDGKYKIIHPSKLNNKSILLIDDVLTTGATTSAIAKILKYAGATKVYVLTFASVSSKTEKEEQSDLFF